jgi:hypothetical protein
MIAILVYIIGLVSTVVTVVLVGFEAPEIYATLLAAYDTGLNNLFATLGTIATSLNWALTPFLGGLLLMGFARIMILLGSINRALRGPA